MGYGASATAALGAYKPRRPQASDTVAPAHARGGGGSARRAEPVLDRHTRAPPRPLNVSPLAATHRSGPVGVRGGPNSVRCHGARTRRGADRTARDAGRLAKDPARTAPEVVARRAQPRHTSTSPIGIPILAILPLARMGTIDPVRNYIGVQTVASSCKTTVRWVLDLDSN